MTRIRLNFLHQNIPKSEYWCKNELIYMYIRDFKAYMYFLFGKDEFRRMNKQPQIARHH